MAGLAGDAKRAVKLHSAHAIARHGKQINCIEPDLKAGAGLVENRAGAGRNVRAAMGARVFLAVGNAVERGIYNAASPTSMAKAEPNFHDVFEARIL